MTQRLPRPSPAKRARALEVLAALKDRYPDAVCELTWTKPHELLVATILSAQSTDVGVNKATPALFERFPLPRDYAAATTAEIEPFVKSLNFWRNKARAVHESMTAICERFGGEVPRTMEELLTLRGVARKTANVVLGNCFGLNEGVVVDTHVGRLAKRLGLSTHDDPVKVERDLMALIPQQDWCLISHLLIFHGRRVCKARGGLCCDDAICQRWCSEGRRPASTRSSPSRPARSRTKRPGPRDAEKHA
ncbi:MAG: endonuclease III [Phycisphaerae bacterium]|nr:endonuclease III [Phycisphaerae bacterium]